MSAMRRDPSYREQESPAPPTRRERHRSGNGGDPADPVCGSRATAFVWLENLPDGWEKKRADALLLHKKRATTTDQFASIDVFHYSIPVVQETGDGALESGSEIDSDKILLDGDELLVSKLNPHKGCVVLAGRQPVPIVASTEFVPLGATSAFDRKFAYYVYSSQPVRGLISAEMKSATRSHQRANPEDITKVWLPVPPLPHQRAIADYLDRETARIDALIAAKERVLRLLAEKRQALITRAVTRGLDPTAPMRDSGIPWLGEIPAHWQTVALRFLVSFASGATPDTARSEYWDGEIPWVSPKDMKRDEIADAEDHVSELALSEGLLRLVAPTAVLVVVRGMILAHSFPTAVTAASVTINQDMKALRCSKSLLPHYLRDFFRGYEQYIVALADSSAHGTRKIETATLGGLEIPLPPVDEQRAIVGYVRSATSRLDNLHGVTELTITLLRERRSGLIAAAVTGQTEVEAKA